MPLFLSVLAAHGMSAARFTDPWPITDHPLALFAWLGVGMLSLAAGAIAVRSSKRSTPAPAQASSSQASSPQSAVTSSAASRVA